MRRIMLAAATTATLIMSAPVLSQGQIPAPQPSDALIADSDSRMAASRELAAALADPRRDEDRARDVYRHPADTLALFDVRPGMTVADFMPSSGWYSRVLIPYLGKDGTYIALNPKVPADATGFLGTLVNTAGRFPAQAQGWGGPEGARVIGANLGDLPDGLAGTVDRLLIFREMHNIRRSGWLHDTMLAARTLLKDDGLIGVVQHRARDDAPIDEVLGDKGYQREADIVALFSAYGFDLEASSDVNANLKDLADWEGGVWTLPPTYSGVGDDAARRAQLDEIGESDRMTLLFRKRP